MVSDRDGAVRREPRLAHGGHPVREVETTPKGSDVLFPVAVATVFIVVLVVGAIIG